MAIPEYCNMLVFSQLNGESSKQMDITLANVRNMNTFRRGEQGSIVDLTFVSDLLVKHLHFHVSEEYTHSGHQAIYITQTGNHKLQGSGKQIGHKITTVNKAWQFSQQIYQICDACMPKHVYSQKGNPNY